MKTAASLLFLLLSVFCLSAQTYPCETTRIGKMVTNPLLRNGTIHYQLAVRDTNDTRAKTGKDITTIVDNTMNDGNVYIARHITEGSITYDLLFVSEKSGKCIYQVTRLGHGGIYGIRLNENGEVIDWDEHTPNTDDMQKDQEKLAEEWLKKFEIVER